MNRPCPGRAAARFALLRRAGTQQPRAARRCMGPGSAAHRASARCAASGAQDASVSLSPRHCEELLRRSNPDCVRGKILDCFRLRQRLRRTSRCARKDGASGKRIALHRLRNCRHTCAFPRLLSPEFCCSFALERPEDAGKAGRRRHPRSVRNGKCTRGGSQVLPVARPSLRGWFRPRTVST